MTGEKVYKLIDLFPYKIKNRELFYHRDHPENLNPDSFKYEEYWDDFIEKCVEGLWVYDEGTWVFMFPQLFYYVNYVVLSNNGKIKPNLTDGEWIVFSYLMGVDGFYGFEDEPEYTCHRLVQRLELGHELDEVELSLIPEKCKKPNGEYKKFMYSWEYLTRLYLVDRPLGKPLGRALYDRPNNGLLLTGRSLGKALKPTEKVLSPSGWREIQNLKVGDKVYGSDGKECTVLSHHPDQKELKFYKLTFEDGREIECCEDHLWKVYDNRKHNSGTSKRGGYRDVSTRDLFTRYRIPRVFKTKNGNRHSFDYRYAIPITKPVEFQKKDLIIHPYILGVLLGDGCISSKQTRFTSGDVEIASEVSKLLKNGYRVSKGVPRAGTSALAYRIGNDQGDRAMRSDLEVLGLQGCKSHDKFIPCAYLHSEIEDRFELLKGLMDTDGYSSDQGTIEYYTVSPKLSEDVLYLCRSLGINAKIFKKQGKYKKDGVEHICKICYIVRMYTDVPVFKLERKLKYLDHQKAAHGSTKYTKTKIKLIEPIESQGGCCITVDSEDSTFITKDFIVTHNSVMLFLGKYSHEWLFSGTRYLEDLYKLNDKYNYAMCCTTSEPLDRSLNAVAYFYANMPGGFKFPKSTERPERKGAIYKRIQGKFKSGNTVEHITKNVDNTVDIQGSVMQAPVLKPDRLKVTSGDRFKLVLLEEAGFLALILKFFGFIKDSLQSQGEKIGSFIGLGTGGDMKTIKGPRKIHNNPDSFGMNSIPNYWSGSLKDRICLFVPAEYSQKDYKDENGNTKLELARAFLERRREKLKEEDLVSYELEIQFNPFDPSDMLRPSGRAWLPKQDSQKMLDKIEAEGLFKTYSKGWLEFIPGDLDRKVEFKYDINNIYTPILSNDEEMDMTDKKGAVVIYEHPDEKPVPGLYYVLYDPAAKSGDGESYHSMIVYKAHNSDVGSAISNGIVAEWIGRLELLDDNYDMAIKLAKYYNCTIFCERNIQGFIEYVRRKNLYSILEGSAPEVEKEISPNGKSSHYLVGWMMTTKYKIWALKKLKQWLLEPSIIDNDGFVSARVIDTIHSVRIHNEIVDHDLVGNFDHISSLLGLMFLIAKIDGEIIEVEPNEELLDQMDELQRQQNNLNSSSEPFCEFMQF